MKVSLKMADLVLQILKNTAVKLVETSENKKAIIYILKY
jgi:hypothetical protein